MNIFRDGLPRLMIELIRYFSKLITISQKINLEINNLNNQKWIGLKRKKEKRKLIQNTKNYFRIRKLKDQIKKA